MQKRVVYNFNAQPATETATGHANGKAVKASNAIGKIKRAFFGKGLKLAVFVVLLFASLFCAIGSADWIISQQKDVPSEKDGTKTFNVDDFGLDKYIIVPTRSIYNGNPVCAEMKTNAVDEARGLPDKAIDKANIKYKVIPYNEPSAQSRLLRAPQNAASTERNKAPAANAATSLPNEDDFKNIDYTKELPTKAGTYAVLITSVVGEVSYGKAIKVFTIAPCPVQIEWSGAVDFTYDGANHLKSITATAKTTDGTPIDGIVTKSFTYKAQGATTSTEVTEVKNAGTYTATAEITNPNYALAEGSNATKDFTISQKELTVKANPHQITYGDAPSTNSYEISGYVNGETFESANISGTAKLTTNYTQFAKVGEYEIRVDISELSSLNYSFKPVNGILTINKKELTVKANDHQVTYGDAPSTKGYTISGFIEGETFESANISGTVKLTTNYTQFAKVGEYEIRVDISELSSLNYSFKAENGILTVNKKELTVKANDHQITYGDEPSANGCTISGFVNNDNESVITGLDKITYIIDYAHLENVGQFSITPKVDGLSAVNYSFKANFGVLTVNALDIQLSGIIECEYDDVNKSPLVFNKDLFANATFTAPSNSTIDLSSVYTYISEAGAKNYDTTNGLAITPENGLFSYAFSNTQSGTKMAGSTYKIDKVTLSNKNFNLTETEVYLKYKTAKIGKTFYTIEDAINLTATGDIILASNSSDTDTYVISAFTSLNYYGNKTFACSKNIIVPHANGATTYENQQTGKTGNVGSVLIIPNGVSLTMDSSSLNILAVISQNNTTNTCTTAKRGVVMNHGTLTVKKQIKSGEDIIPNILAYGYLKGNGNVNVENGATVQDLFHLYDFKGGGITYGIHESTKEYLPINSYSIHNISCNVRVNAGCVYNTYYEITMGGEWFNGIIPVVSTAESSALFKLSSGYIEKRAIPAESATWKNKKDSTGITYGESLDKINGSNQLAGQKEDIRICGATVDGSISITIKLVKWGLTVKTVTMETGTNNPLPVPYMDIRVCNGGDLSLVNSSYKFMPGSSLTVDDGGKLTLDANAKLVLYSVEDCSVLEAPATYKEKSGTVKDYPYSFITRYCIDKVNAYLLINSNNVTLNGGVSGEIASEKSGIKIEIKKGSTDITVLNVIHDGAKDLLGKFDYADITTRNASTARPMKPCGNILNSSSTAEETHFGTGTYYSTKIDSGYAWFKNSATITYDPNGGTLNETSGNTTETVTLPSGGYTNLPTPTRDYYKFKGWYFDAALTQEATAIYTDCTLYAKWAEEEYTIIFNIPDGFGKFNPIKLYGEHAYNLPTLDTVTKDGQTYYFDNWYLYADYSGTAIKQVSAENANEQKIINVYAFYRGETYTVNYEENPEGLEFTSEIKKEDKPSSQVFDKGKTISVNELQSLVQYNTNDSFNYYFAGWYLSTDSDETIITSLPNTIDGDITLCAKWIKKAQLKIEMPVFENGNRTGNTIVYDTHKYFYKQKIEEIGINNLSSYIGAVYTVPESYKFIGFNASSGFTTKQHYSNMNNITTTIEVGETSNDLTITADIRKILKVDITMSASATYTHDYGTKLIPNKKSDTKYFSINEILIGSNVMYSINNSDWLISNGTTDLKQKTTGTQTFYVLEGNTDIKITVENINPSVKLTSVSKPHSHTFTASNIPKFETTGCTKPESNSPFTFTITNNNVTINWSGQATFED